MLSPQNVQAIVEKNAKYLAMNEELIEIFEGELTSYIEDDLSKQLSGQTLTHALARLCPINVLPKYVDKLTNIYQTSVTREILDGTDSDAKLLSWFVDKIDANTQMNSGNELFNLSKATLIQPYVHDGKPGLRVILNDRFIAYSTDPVCPEKPTHIIIKAGFHNEQQIYFTYSKDGFMISNARGEIERELMVQADNEEGVNPIGRLPFVYVNESKYRVQPKLDTDTLRIVKLLPVMLTDLNVAAMFQSFSILYGIDMNDENLVMAPNAFWRFTSDPASEKKPEIGQIKPTVDYDQVLNLIQSELSMWLGTKGIRAGSIGSLDPSQMASGISKVIDEMDTYEAREKQVSYFEHAERDLWDLIMHHMLPYWQSRKEIDQIANFSPNATVSTTFAIQLPSQTRGQVVKDMNEEYVAGFTSKRRAMIKLNPEMTETEVDMLIAEIAEERAAEPVVEPEAVADPIIQDDKELSA